MNHLKTILVCLSTTALAACGSGESIVGKWAQPVPGMPDIKQGFVLDEGGKASSINMATLSYETWRQQGSLLILSGKSIGNGLTIPFSDTLSIEGLTRDSLILKKGKLTLPFARETTGRENDN